VTDQAITDFRPVPGLRLGSAAAGIKYADRDDLVIIEMAEGGSCAGVYTRNAFCAAPVTIAKKHQAETTPRYLLVNSGNANAGTGQHGLLAAAQSCSALAEAEGVESELVLPFSTGVIGEPLPIDRISNGIPMALADLNEQGWARAAAAIMTTDTVPKLVSRQFQWKGETITVTGMAKGSGMIRPDMATMLAYVATDLEVDQTVLQSCLEKAVAPSFNSITVDGDTSTNDACILMATGVSKCSPLANVDNPLYTPFSEAVAEVCLVLARAIVKDGEGATKLVVVRVEGGASKAEASEVAYTIAHSPLVKTAFFASDPNWGRILAAVGRAGIDNLDVEQIRIYLDDVEIVARGGRAETYTEEAGQAVFSRDEFTVRVHLGRGEQSALVLTCDLSYDYVKINAEYRS